jgi:hypothetical protein
MKDPTKRRSGQSNSWQEIEHERDDDINHHKLDSFEPVGLAVPANNRAKEHADEERADFRATE